MVVLSHLRHNDGAGLANRDHPRLEDIMHGIVNEPDPERPEWLVMELALEIQVSHGRILAINISSVIPCELSRICTGTISIHNAFRGDLPDAAGVFLLNFPETRPPRRILRGSFRSGLKV
jgi:hypothetical protein